MNKIVLAEDSMRWQGRFRVLHTEG